MSCTPRFDGLEAAPMLKRAPKTRALTLYRTVSLQSESPLAARQSIDQLAKSFTRDGGVKPCKR